MVDRGEYHMATRTRGVMDKKAGRQGGREGGMGGAEGGRASKVAPGFLHNKVYIYMLS